MSNTYSLKGSKGASPRLSGPLGKGVLGTQRVGGMLWSIKLLCRRNGW